MCSGVGSSYAGPGLPLDTITSSFPAPLQPLPCLKCPAPDGRVAPLKRVRFGTFPRVFGSTACSVADSSSVVGSEGLVSAVPDDSVIDGQRPRAILSKLRGQFPKCRRGALTGRVRSSDKEDRSSRGPRYRVRLRYGQPGRGKRCSRLYPTGFPLDILREFLPQGGQPIPVAHTGSLVSEESPRHLDTALQYDVMPHHVHAAPPTSSAVASGVGAMASGVPKLNSSAPSVSRCEMTMSTEQAHRHDARVQSWVESGISDWNKYCSSVGFSSQGGVSHPTSAAARPMENPSSLSRTGLSDESVGSSVSVRVSGSHLNDVRMASSTAGHLDPDEADLISQYEQLPMDGSGSSGRVSLDAPSARPRQSSIKTFLRPRVRSVTSLDPSAGKEEVGGVQLRTAPMPVASPGVIASEGLYLADELGGSPVILGQALLGDLSQSSDLAKGDRGVVGGHAVQVALATPQPDSASHIGRWLRGSGPSLRSGGSLSDVTSCLGRGSRGINVIQPDLSGSGSPRSFLSYYFPLVTETGANVVDNYSQSVECSQSIFEGIPRPRSLPVVSLAAVSLVAVPAEYVVRETEALELLTSPDLDTGHPASFLAPTNESRQSETVVVSGHHEDGFSPLFSLDDGWTGSPGGVEADELMVSDRLSEGESDEWVSHSNSGLRINRDGARLDVGGQTNMFHTTAASEGVTSDYVRGDHPASNRDPVGLSRIKLGERFDVGSYQEMLHEAFPGATKRVFTAGALSRSHRISCPGFRKMASMFAVRAFFKGGRSVSFPLHDTFCSLISSQSDSVASLLTLIEGNEADLVRSQDEEANLELSQSAVPVESVPGSNIFPGETSTTGPSYKVAEGSSVLALGFTSFLRGVIKNDRTRAVHQQLTSYSYVQQVFITTISRVSNSDLPNVSPSHIQLEFASQRTMQVLINRFQYHVQFSLVFLEYTRLDTPAEVDRVLSGKYQLPGLPFFENLTQLMSRLCTLDALAIIPSIARFREAIVLPHNLALIQSVGLCAYEAPISEHPIEQFIETLPSHPTCCIVLLSVSHSLVKHRLSSEWVISPDYPRSVSYELCTEEFMSFAISSRFPWFYKETSLASYDVKRLSAGTPSQCACVARCAQCINRATCVECSTMCKAKGCTNNFFQQHGLVLYSMSNRLVLNRSPIHEWGVFFSTGLSRNEFVGLYTGRVHSENDQYMGVVSEYRMYLGTFMGVRYYMDAKPSSRMEASSWMKYVNHSCTPNCYVVIWIVKGYPVPVFFTSRAVREGEEATINYRMSYVNEHGRRFCRCKAPGLGVHYFESWNVSGVALAARNSIVPVNPVDRPPDPPPPIPTTFDIGNE